MPDYRTPRNKSGGSITDQSDSCRNCNGEVRRFGRTGRIDAECVNCGVVATTADTPRIATDGGRPQAVNVLATINDTDGHADHLQRFAAGESHRTNLSTSDVTRPLQIAMGDLCLVVEFRGKTEFVWPTEVGWIAHTEHHDRQTDWGPIPLSRDEVERRVHQIGHTLSIRASETVSFDPPEQALSEGVPA